MENIRIDSQEELLTFIEGFDSEQARVDFLRNYIREQKGVTSELFAVAHEALANIVEEGDAFEKAGSVWEKLWLVREEESGERFLKKALNNYRRAVDAYEATTSSVLAEKVKLRIVDVRAQLRGDATFNTFPRVATLIVTAASFLFATFFFSFNFTGFAVSEANQTQAVWTGLFFLFAGFLGLFFAVRWWR